MKLFKTITLFIILLLLGTTFYSCSDDDTYVITLEDGQSPLTFNYPTSYEDGYTYALKGGDGNYSVKSNNESVITTKMISATEFNVKVIGLGKTTITVTDKSNNTLTLDATVDYRTEQYIVTKLDITIAGDNLTEEEKKAISEKYLSQVPVKVNGGYKFIFSETPYDRGVATIYTDIYGDKGVETTFTLKEIKKEDYPEIEIFSAGGYEIVIDGEARTFLLGKYKASTRMTEVTPVALMENITAKVQKEYPKAGLVYTSQVIVKKFD